MLFLCRPHVYTIHSKQPDSAGHQYGPYKDEVGVTGVSKKNPFIFTLFNQLFVLFSSSDTL